VERTDDAALEDVLKAFNRVGVNRTDNVLAGTVLIRHLRSQRGVLEGKWHEHFGN
jgi:hypothetical protein